MSVDGFRTLVDSLLAAAEEYDSAVLCFWMHIGKGDSLADLDDLRRRRRRWDASYYELLPHLPELTRIKLCALHPTNDFQLGGPSREQGETISRSIRVITDIVQAAETAAYLASPCSPAAQERIPNPSAPHTLKHIAAVWGGDMKPKKLRPMIGKSVKGKALNRQTWIVCLDDVPVAARKKLAPTEANSAQHTPTAKQVAR